MSHQKDSLQTLQNRTIKELQKITANTENIEVSVDEVELDLERFSGHSNNTTAIGDGSTQLRVVPLGYNQSAGQVRSFLVDASGNQSCNIVSGGDITSKLDSLAGAGNNNVGEGSSKLQVFNYGRDVAAGNFKPLVCNSSAEQIVALSSVDNTVLDNISAHTATVDGCVASNKMNVNISSLSGGSGLATEAKQDDIEASLTSIESKIDTLDTVLDNSLLKHTSIDNSLTSHSTTHTNAEVHLGNIDTGIDVLEACVGSNKVNVNISSGNITGFATSTLQGGGLPAALSNGNLKVSIQEGNITGFATSSNQSTTNTKLGTIETDIEATNTLLTTIDGVLDNAEAHLGNIQTAVQSLDNAVDGNFLNVNLNLAGSDVANNSGNKSNTCPRVVIATDDVNLSAIKATHDITTTTIHNNVSIAGSSNNTSATVISFTHYPRSISIFAGDFTGSQSISGSQVTISPLFSFDNSTYFDLSTFLGSGGGSPVFVSQGEGLTTKFMVIENARFPFMKIKLTNGAGGAINFHSVVSF